MCRNFKLSDLGFPPTRLRYFPLRRPNPKLKLLDQVSEVMRFKHYSIRTEMTFDWIACRPLSAFISVN